MHVIASLLLPVSFHCNLYTFKTLLSTLPFPRRWEEPWGSKTQPSSLRLQREMGCKRTVRISRSFCPGCIRKNCTGARRTIKNHHQNCVFEVFPSKHFYYFKKNQVRPPHLLSAPKGMRHTFSLSLILQATLGAGERFKRNTLLL